MSGDERGSIDQWKKQRRAEVFDSWSGRISGGDFYLEKTIYLETEEGEVGSMIDTFIMNYSHDLSQITCIKIDSKSTEAYNKIFK